MSARAEWWRWRELAMIVGNGLSIDLRCGIGRDALAAWDTSAPLGWQLGTPGMPERSLLESLPAFSAALRELGLADTATDFDRFAALAVRCRAARLAMFSKPATDAPAGIGALSESNVDAVLQADSQARQFLAIAYSHYQRRVDSIDLSGWKWVRWLRSVGGRMRVVTSLNYDMIIETACELAGLRLARVQVRGTPAIGTVLFKPHGSIDFGHHPSFLTFGRKDFARLMQGVVVQNDGPIAIVPRDELLNIRRAAEIVLPVEASPVSEFQWVRPWYARLPRLLAYAEHLVIAGVSYWEHDRAEINAIIDALPATAEIIVANPYPPPELRAYVEGVGRRYREWRGDPEPL